MANISPFLCIRPREDLADKIAALPYDVYNREEAKEVVQRQPYSFLKIDRAETQLEDTVDTYDEKVYQTAAETLQSMIEKGEFVQSEQSCYYIYELIMNGRSQTGITACASIDDYLNHVIKKHENTRTDKEEDRIRHVETCGAQTGPIFLAYRKNEVIHQVIQKVKQQQPLYDFCAEDGIQHLVWEISSQQDIDTIQKAFENISEIYIADGHHRAASAVKVGLKKRKEQPNYTGQEPFNYFLSVLFADDELMILDYNRVVHDLHGYTKEQFLQKLEEQFFVKEWGTEAYQPKAQGEFGLFLNHTWYQLCVKERKATDNPVERLDVSILQEEVLESILGIHDPKIDQRIHFVGGIRGLQELERQANQYEEGIAFSMYPTSIQELFEVADAGLLMPPKSTWFEPKLRSGLFIHKI